MLYCQYTICLNTVKITEKQQVVYGIITRMKEIVVQMVV